METLKVNNVFYFSAHEILKVGKIRSFFSRMKSSRHEKQNASVDKCEEEFKDDKAVTERRKRHNMRDDTYPVNTLTRKTSFKRHGTNPVIDPKRRSLRTSNKEN